MLEGWIVEPTREVKAAAVRLQESLRRFSWIDLVPEHFLHVWLGVPERLGDAPQRWPELTPFEIALPALELLSQRGRRRGHAACAPACCGNAERLTRSSFRT